MKQKVLIVGAGEGGSTLLRLLQSSNIFQIIGIIDINPIAKRVTDGKGIRDCDWRECDSVSFYAH